MTCPNCGRWAPADPETGYDADELCSTCQADGWTATASGDLIQDVAPGIKHVVTKDEPADDEDDWSGGFADNH